ncbi:MAG: AMP-binding protein [Bacteroidaceae bacterium]|nr:AMP-binding protein [Bacteroidaceae bacterium]
MISDYHKTAIIVGDKRVSFSEMLEHVRHFAHVSGQQAGGKTVIFSENSAGWIYAIFSVWLNEGIAVPVDAMSTVDDTAYILRDCEPQLAWVSAKTADVMRKAIAEAGTATTLLVIEDVLSTNVLTSAETQGTQSISADSAPSLDRLFVRDEERTALICYTSGTTGTPKGVMLSFRNMFANVRSVSEEVPIYTDHTRVLILLPLHHVLPLLGTLVAPMMLGAGVIICPSMAAPDIMATLQTGEVNLIIGVPRLWQTIYNGIKRKIDASALTRFLFWLCGRIGSLRFSRFVFKAVQKKLGGHLEFCVNGGAALPVEVAAGMKTLGIDLLDGYGMTETAPMISFTRPGELVPGSVGKAMPSVEVKLVDGELCAKGPNVMQGYYNRPEETAEVIDADGFIHTGDLATIREDGRIFITGRTKEIIVLSNGKNVNPTEIEQKLERHEDIVKEVGVCPDGDKLCALIVPDERWAAGRSDEELEQALKRDVIEPYNSETESYKRVLSVRVIHGDLPRTRMEKLQRYRLPELLASPKTKSQQSASEQPKAEDRTITEEYAIIKKYIEDEKRVVVHPTDNLETDLALDSLDKVGLQSFIEQTFGMALTADKLTRFRDVEELATYVADAKTRVEVEKTDWATILREDTSHVVLPKAGWITHAIVGLGRGLSRAYFSLKGSGMENLPADGPFILTPNHQSYFDGLFVVSFLPKKLLTGTYFFAKREHVRTRFAKFMARHNNVIVINQNNLKESIQTLGEALKGRKRVIIFPEGTRTVTGALGPFKKMFAILSRELQVPIVPVVISGAYKALPKGRHIPKRVHVAVEYLPPVLPSDKSYDALCDEVMNHIEDALY